MTRWLVNGVPDALVPPTDRGLLYGDGLFETVAFHNGKSALWPLHMARLAEGCRRLALPAPDVELLAAECGQLVGDRARVVIRLAITRGSGGKAYFPPAQPEPTRILIRRGFPAELSRQRESGIAMRTSPFRLAGDWLGGDCLGGLGALKHMNRLAQVIIAEDCDRHGAAEALVLDDHDMIVEGLAGNIVVVQNGRMIAPGPHPAAVAGVGLEWLRQRAGTALVERPFAAGELGRDDAVWVINSVRGPCGVCALDGRALMMVPCLREWQQRWREEIEE